MEASIKRGCFPIHPASGNTRSCEPGTSVCIVLVVAGMSLTALLRAWKAGSHPTDFQPHDFDGAWWTFNDGLHAELDRKPQAKSIELIFLGPGLQPVAEVLTCGCVAAVAAKRHLSVHVKFYDAKYIPDGRGRDVELDEAMRSLLGGQRWKAVLPAVKSFQVADHHTRLSSMLRKRATPERATVLAGFNGMRLLLPSDAHVWKAIAIHRGHSLIFHDFFSQYWKVGAAFQYKNWTVDALWARASLANYSSLAGGQRDHLLWSGNLDFALGQQQAHSIDVLRERLPMYRAQVLVQRRLVLRLASLLEPWAVLLERTIEGGEPTMRGRAANWAEDVSLGLTLEPAALLGSCSDGVHPSPASLYRAAQRSAQGLVMREDVARAIGACCRYHGIWEYMIPHEAARGQILGARNRFGWTALHMASAAGFAEAVEDLLNLGAEPMAVTTAQLTPLHVAILHGRPAAALALASAPRVAEALGRSGVKQLRRQLEAAKASAAGGREALRSECALLLRALGDDATTTNARCSAAPAFGQAVEEQAYDEGDEGEPWPP